MICIKLKNTAVYNYANITVMPCRKINLNTHFTQKYIIFIDWKILSFAKIYT